MAQRKGYEIRDVRRRKSRKLAGDANRRAAKAEKLWARLHAAAAVGQVGRRVRGE